jgi:putative ABC transport system permease protein
MRKYFSLEDALAIKETCPAVANVAVSAFPGRGFATAKFRNETMVGLDFRGTTPEYASVYGNAAMEAGRFFTESENQHRADVIVAGHDLAKSLFGALNPVGTELQINGHSFEVVGVLERPSGGFVMGPGGEDRRAIIPYWTLRKLYPGIQDHFIRVEARTNEVNQAVDQIRSLLRQRRRVPFEKPDDFSLSTSDQAIEQFHQITGMVALVMVVLSSIGLLVGGIGVMNIMLVSVTERTREIGIRKALGARRRDITMQFLLEAMTLTASGGLIGILIGALLSFTIRALVPSLPTTVPLWTIAAGLTVSLSVGLFFGLWPAMKAARLDPVVALRYE